MPPAFGRHGRVARDVRATDGGRTWTESGWLDGANKVYRLFVKRDGTVLGRLPGVADPSRAVARTLLPRSTAEPPARPSKPHLDPTPPPRLFTSSFPQPQPQCDPTTLLHRLTRRCGFPPA